MYGVYANTSSSKEAPEFYRELADRSGGVFLSMKQMSLIRDMFLAVCYKESSPENLAAFQKEVEKRDGGKMDTERFI